MFHQSSSQSLGMALRLRRAFSYALRLPCDINAFGIVRSSNLSRLAGGCGILLACTMTFISDKYSTCTNLAADSTN